MAAKEFLAAAKPEDVKKAMKEAGLPEDRQKAILKYLKTPTTAPPAETAPVGTNLLEALANRGGGAGAGTPLGGTVGNLYQALANRGGARPSINDLGGDYFFNDRYEAMPGWMSNPLAMEWALAPRAAQQASRNWLVGANQMPPSNVSAEQAALTNARGNLLATQEAQAGGLDRAALREAGLQDARQFAAQQAALIRQGQQRENLADFYGGLQGDINTVTPGADINLPLQRKRLALLTGISEEEAGQQLADAGITPEYVKEQQGNATYRLAVAQAVNAGLPIPEPTTPGEKKIRKNARVAEFVENYNAAKAPGWWQRRFGDTTTRDVRADVQALVDQAKKELASTDKNRLSQEDLGQLIQAMAVGDPQLRQFFAEEMGRLVNGQPTQVEGISTVLPLK